MYRTEADFSRALKAKLVKAGYEVSRVESHGTSVGFPDMYVQGFGDDFWLELKNDSKLTGTKSITVKWRPGQQAWHNTYYHRHYGHKQVVTLISGAEGVYVVRMCKIYKDNKVMNPWFIPYKDWNKLPDIVRLLDFAVHNVLNIQASHSMREAICKWVDAYYPLDTDYDPEVLMPDCDKPFSPTAFFDYQFNLWRNI